MNNTERVELIGAIAISTLVLLATVLCGVALYA